VYEMLSRAARSSSDLMSYAHLVAGLHASHTIAISSSAVPAVATAINIDMNSVFIVSS